MLWIRFSVVLVGVALAIDPLIGGSEQSSVSRSGASAQRSTVELSPVPIWPADGFIPKELATKYVFYDVDHEEYVVSYPQNLGTPEFEKNPGPRLVKRFGTTRGSEASISFQVTRNQDKFQYSYQIANAPTARKAIMTWSLAMPTVPDGPVTSPTYWVASAGSSKIAEVGNALGEPRITGAFTTWLYMDEERAPIAPGKQLDNFSVTSSYKPGMSAAYIRAGNISTPPSDLPEEVIAQLGRVTSMTFNAQSVIVVAPRFAPNTSRARIAQDFHSGVNRMIEAGQLDRQSRAVQEALDRLGVYFRSVEVFKNVPLTLGQKASNATEKALQEAIVAAMN